MDNVTVREPSGDLFVAEDGGNLELVWLHSGGVGPFLRAVGGQHLGSEIAGPCFSPDGRRLYFSSQRADRYGMTMEVTGPFLDPGALPAVAPVGTGIIDEGGDSSVLPVVGLGAAGVLTAGAALLLRDRRRQSPPTSERSRSSTSPTAG